MHPIDVNLVGYLLGALDHDEHGSVEDYLHAHPDARQKLDRLRRALEPLEADRDAPDLEPPPQLVMATLARVAEARAEAPPEEPPRTLPFAPGVPASQRGGGGRWHRPDALVAAAIVLVALGLGASWLHKSWFQSDLVACKENLHRFHSALAAYSELRGGAFPRVDEKGPHNYAGVFVPVLHESGALREGVSITCPSQGRRPPPLDQWAAGGPDRYREAVRDLAGSYAYSLGYRHGDGVVGLRRGDPAGQPILADGPPSRDPADAGLGNSSNHRGRGQNVLFVDGSVRYVTTRAVGADDDIYLNQHRRVGAGVHPRDAVLGASDAHP